MKPNPCYCLAVQSQALALEKGCAALKNVQIVHTKCTEQEWLWPWRVCSQSAEEQVALGEERGAGRRSWRWDVSMETREAAARHNPLPCPQHLPVQGVPLLNLCALKCTFSVLVIGSRLLEELPGVVVNTFP